MNETRTIEEMAAAGMARIQQEQLAAMEQANAKLEVLRNARLADWMTAFDVVKSVIPEEMWPDLQTPDMEYFPGHAVTWHWERMGYAPLLIHVYRRRDLNREPKEHKTPLWTPWQTGKQVFFVKTAHEGALWDYEPGFFSDTESFGTDLEKALGFAKMQAENLDLFWADYNAEKAARIEADKEFTYEPVDVERHTDLVNELGNLITQIVRAEIARTTN